MIISQSVLSGNAEKKQKILSGKLEKNQKVLSGNVAEKITTNAKWGKITGDINTQEDLITLLEDYKNVVTQVELSLDGESVTFYLRTPTGGVSEVTVPLDWILNRIKRVENESGEYEDILYLQEFSEVFSSTGSGGTVTFNFPELIFWLNDGSIDGRSLPLATKQGIINMLLALKNYIDSNVGESAWGAITGDISDQTDLVDYIADSIEPISEQEIDAIVLGDLI